MSLRKIIKTRGSFPSEEAALKLLFLALRNVSKKWNMVQEWKQALNEDGSELTNGNPADVRARPSRLASVDARLVLAGKGTLCRAKSKRALGSSAPLRPAIFATSGSGGNIGRAISVQGTAGLTAAKQERRLHKIVDTTWREVSAAPLLRLLGRKHIQITPPPVYTVPVTVS